MNICCYNNRPERRNPRIKYVYLPGPAGPAGSTGATRATGSTLRQTETLWHALSGTWLRRTTFTQPKPLFFTTRLPEQ